MNHYGSVFRNSCVKVPVDPRSKMPRTNYERRKHPVEQNSIETSSSCSVTVAPIETNKLKNFYKSIPDYNDINHLSSDEFYSTLRSLREKKKVMLGIAIENIDCNGDIDKTLDLFVTKDDVPIQMNKNTKSKINSNLRRKLSNDSKSSTKSDTNKPTNPGGFFLTKNSSEPLKRPVRKATISDDKIPRSDLKVTSMKSNLEKSSERPRRNHSACSISWNDMKIEPKSEVDHKFDHYFDGRKYESAGLDDDEFKTQSMPSSPLRMRSSRSPSRRRKSITIPKPFKMTERDEEDRMVNQLRSLQKSFSEDMLHQKCERKKFRARTVPIESRIPLYDKILEDQAMRRALTKINSEAELRAQMKPFSFTKREEKSTGVCERNHTVPKPKKKRFRARPVPKNLFSNYFYNRIKEDEFFRSLNKRIRAEEMLKSSSYPGTMAARDRSRLSTPAAHSDLPIDPSPGVPSTSSSSERRCASPMKKRKEKVSKEDFITTSPQPFKLNTADRAAKKMQEVTKKIYQDSKSTESIIGSNVDGPRARVYSALELRANAAGRSNLAALLRAESVRRRFEIETARRQVESRRRADLKFRDKLLRSKPAWHLVRNNHEEDIAMRLQTRRDEERMRREEFLHEMELMYSRVHQQPMMFERYYAPRSMSAPLEAIQLSPRKTKKKNKCYLFNSPTRSRKVSINTEACSGDVAEYLNKIDMDEKYFGSETSLDRCN